MSRAGISLSIFCNEDKLLLLILVVGVYWVHSFISPPFFSTHHELRTTNSFLSSVVDQSSDVGVAIKSSRKNVGVKIELSDEKSSHTKRHRKTWEAYYPALKGFYEKHGHSNVSAKDDENIYKFISSLRKNYRHQVVKNINMSTKNRQRKHLQYLSKEKLQALKDIEFVWELPSNRSKWDTYYPKLREFYIKHGHSNVKLEDDEDLNRYVVSIRRNYMPYNAANISSTVSSKSKRVLPEEKLRALTDLKFSFQPPRRVTPGWKTWDVCFPRLKSFYDEHGHSNVPDDYDQDLTLFIRSLRKNYRHHATGKKSSLTLKKGRYKLPNDKLEALKEIDFRWYKYKNRKSPRRWKNPSNHTGIKLSNSPRKAVGGKKRKYRNWNQYYPKLKGYYNIHGHCNLTLHDDKDLYLWTESLKKRKLPVDKRRILQSLGIPVINSRVNKKPKQISTKEMVHRLGIHQELFGRISVDKKEDPDLSRWTKSFIRRNGCSKLWELLEFPPQDGNWREGCWNEMYEKLSNLCNGNEYYQVGEDPNKLNHFIRDSRRQYRLYQAGRQSVLTQDRIESMDQIGFEWIKAQKHRLSQERRWNKMVEELLAFRGRHGHTLVPQECDENPKLGCWVMNQRTFYRMNQVEIDTPLTSERIEQLEQIDFVWNVHEKYWWDMFNRLKDYQKLHENFIIAPSDSMNEDLRFWLNEQRYYYRNEVVRYRISQDRIDALESLPGFRWNGKQANIPTKYDWTQLLSSIREMGISPEAKAKEHWFDGVNPLKDEVKSVWTDDELLALWNEDNDEDD